MPADLEETFQQTRWDPRNGGTQLAISFDSPSELEVFATSIHIELTSFFRWLVGWQLQCFTIIKPLIGRHKNTNSLDVVDDSLQSFYASGQ